jgi:hypothetical protein
MLKKLFDKYGSIGNIPDSEIDFKSRKNILNEINKIEKRYKTLEFYKDLIKKRLIFKIDNIPGKFREYEIYRLGILNSDYLIFIHPKNIPENFLDRNMYLTFIESNHNYYSYFSYIVFDSNFYLDAVKRNGNFIIHLDEKLRNDWKYIKASILSKIEYLHNRFIDYIPEEKRNFYFYLKFSKKILRFSDINCIPRKYRNKKVCLQLLKSIGNNFQQDTYSFRTSIPQKLINLSFLISALRNIKEEKYKYHIVFKIYRTYLNKKTFSYYTF